MVNTEQMDLGDVSQGFDSPYPTLVEVERDYMLQILSMVGGNKSAAARILGIDRRTLYRKLDWWSLKVTSDERGGILIKDKSHE